MDHRWIPVAAPLFVGNEKTYVMDCLESTWISSNGPYVEKFEAAFADFCGVTYAVSCCNGTAALHLALMALGVGSGDEVIIPTLTFVATANAVAYCGARPVFVDSEADSWNIDPLLIETSITPRTKGIIAVHLYGHPANMDPILAIARKHGLFVIEDAAEAHGAEYKGQKAGALGDIAIFSFFGNKIITTGEGGMVVTNEMTLASKVRQLRDQGMDRNRRYWFPTIGYNYRMTNIAAAIGLAQLEKVDWHLQRRREVVGRYVEHLQSARRIAWQAEQQWAKHVYWMFTIVLDDANVPVGRDDLMDRLRARGIETRPVFHPMHTLPPYRSSSHTGRYPIAERIARQGLNLPTAAGLTVDDLRYVCDTLLECLSDVGA
jgi:perosamine synthetase